MRNWALVGVAAALLPGCAFGATYKGVKEVCLFSPTLLPADSALAITSIGPDYDFVHGFRAGSEGRAANGSKELAGGSIATTTMFLKGIYEPHWYPGSDGKLEDIDSSSGFDFPANAESGTANEVGPKFKFSGVSSVGVESNGFVAGFDMKY
jgi:hypothetical protein